MRRGNSRAALVSIAPPLLQHRADVGGADQALVAGQPAARHVRLERLELLGARLEFLGGDQQVDLVGRDVG